MESQQELDNKTSAKMHLRCKKFEYLALFVSKQKPGGAGKGVSRQDIVCDKCKKTEYYASQCQLSTESISNSTYCGKYGHTNTACYKKQAGEARQKAQDKTKQQVQIFKK